MYMWSILSAPWPGIVDISLACYMVHALTRNHTVIGSIAVVCWLSWCVQFLIRSQFLSNKN